MNIRKCFYVMIVTMLLGGSLLLSGSLTTTYGQAEEGPKWGGVLVSAWYSDPVTLNPDITWSWPTHALCSAVYQRLFGFNMEETGFIPELALSWEVSDDGLTYTFHLTKNATFHDGVPFTSADVKFSFEEILIEYLGPYSALKDWLDLPTETPDDYTWVVKLKKPMADFLLKLTYYGFYVLPKHLYEGTDILNNPYNWNPVGTGPYVFKEYVKGSHAIVERNPNYWKPDLPYLDRLAFKVIPTTSARIMAVDNREVDFLMSWPPHLEAVPRWKDDPYLNVLIVPGVVGPPEVFPNHEHPILKYLTVRQAIALATDKNYILERMGPPGTVYLVDGPIPSVWEEWHNPEAEQKEFDVDEANRLLDEAGYPKGPDGIRFELSIIYDAANAEYVTISEAFSGLMELHVGIRVNLVPLETAILYKRLEESDFELATYGISRGPDVGKGLAVYWSGGIELPGTMTNIGLFRNDEYDELYLKQESETNYTKRKEMIFRMQEILVDEVAGIWLPEPYDMCMFPKKFKDFPTDAYNFETFETVWTTEGIDVSPSDVTSAFTSAEEAIAAPNATNVDLAQAKLDLAKEKYNPADSATWIQAKSLAEEAKSLAEQTEPPPPPAEPPYWLYAAVIIIVVAVAAGAAYTWRRRKVT